MVVKPDFLVVGAAKSGTTSLFHYLKRHPGIYIPEIKECRFFSQLPNDFIGLGAEFFPNNGIRDASSYFELFEHKEGKCCGDISNDYLYYYKDSINQIKKYLGTSVKIIIVLRNPIDRAYSNYMHAYRDGWENLTFEESIIEEASRVRSNWAWPYHYVRTGFYYRQVKAYMDSFSNVKVFLYEDFNDTGKLMNDLLSFLEVDNVFYEEVNKKYNVSGLPKNKLIHYLVNNKKLKKLGKPIRSILPDGYLNKIKSRNLEKRELNDKTRSYLKEIYLTEIMNLSELIGKDLSAWVCDEV